MENFEGGSGNPEIKKLGFRARLGLALAALGITVGSSVSPKVETPNEFRSGEPPKPGEIPVLNPPTPQGPKNI